MDRKTSLQAYPFSNLGCHPGWITPPANIYLSIDFITTQCKGPNESKLSPTETQTIVRSTLYHEFGHALEFQLLGESGLALAERYHSEGFAVWFEHEVLSIAGPDSEAKLIENKARNFFQVNWNPYSFDGSSTDYFRAYAFISAILDRYPAKIGRVYEYMSLNNVNFETSLKIVLDVDRERWQKLALKKWGAKSG
jgi:hypothetical protein